MWGFGVGAQGTRNHIKRTSPRDDVRDRLEREFFLDNLLVRINFIIVMIRWTGLAPWEFEFPFTFSLTSAFLDTDFVKSSGPTWLGFEVKKVRV